MAAVPNIEIARLKLTELRVAELKQLLCHFIAGEKRSGLTKATLLEKSVALFESKKFDRTAIFQKITELHAERWGYATSSTAGNSSSESASSSSRSTPKDDLPIGVRESFPFFQSWAILVPPTSTTESEELLVGMRGTNIRFRLTKAMLDKQKEGDALQVLLFFSRKSRPCMPSVDSTYVTYPRGYCVTVNQRPYHDMLPGGKGFGERDHAIGPLDITEKCYLRPGRDNFLGLLQHLPQADPYNFSVEFGRRLTPAFYLDIIKTRKNAVDGRQLIKETASKSRCPNDVALSFGDLLLTCPISAMRLEHPGRAKSCMHLQCFDMSVYLEMNERRPKWLCPICRKSANLKDLLIDPFVVEILDKTSVDISRVEIHPDGSWTPISSQPERGEKRKGDACSSDGAGSSKRAKECDQAPVIDLTGVSDSESAGSSKQASTRSSKGKGKSKKLKVKKSPHSSRKTKRAIVID